MLNEYSLNATFYYFCLKNTCCVENKEPFDPKILKK